MTPELILYHAPLLLERGADAVALRCGRIAAVGRSEEVLHLRGPGTELLDLKGRPLLPGFFDAHVHFIQTGLDRVFYVDLSQARSLAEALESLARAGKARPGGGWWAGGGMNRCGRSAATWSGLIWIGGCPSSR